MSNIYRVMSTILFVLLLSLGLLTGCNLLQEADAPEEIVLSEQREAVDAAVAWLIENNQNDDGGYGIDFDSGKPSSAVGSTLDAIMAISSAGVDPDSPLDGGEATPVGYLRDNADSVREFAEALGGNAGKVILALKASDLNPSEFAAKDWVMMLTDQYSDSGQYNASDAFNQSLAILALTAVGEPVPEAAVSWLKDQQDVDGSWDDGFGTMQNADATALAIMALSASGSSTEDPELKLGVQFLAGNQLPSGGWEYGPGFGENVNSTALAIQALAATGNDFYSDNSSWAKNGSTPLDALAAWQNSTGAFQADFGQGAFDDYFSTVQAIPAAAGKSLPLPAWNSE